MAKKRIVPKMSRRAAAKFNAESQMRKDAMKAASLTDSATEISASVAPVTEEPAENVISFRKLSLNQLQAILDELKTGDETLEAEYMLQRKDLPLQNRIDTANFFSNHEIVSEKLAELLEILNAKELPENKSPLDMALLDGFEQDTFNAYDLGQAVITTIRLNPESYPNCGKIYALPVSAITKEMEVRMAQNVTVDTNVEVLLPPVAKESAALPDSLPAKQSISVNPDIAMDESVLIPAEAVSQEAGIKVKQPNLFARLTNKYNEKKSALKSTLAGSLANGKQAYDKMRENAATAYNNNVDAIKVVYSDLSGKTTEFVEDSGKAFLSALKKYPRIATGIVTMTLGLSAMMSLSSNSVQKMTQQQSKKITPVEIKKDTATVEEKIGTAIHYTMERPAQLAQAETVQTKLVDEDLTADTSVTALEDADSVHVDSEILVLSEMPTTPNLSAAYLSSNSNTLIAKTDSALRSTDAIKEVTLTQMAKENSESISRPSLIKRTFHSLGQMFKSSFEGRNKHNPNTNPDFRYQ